MNIEYDLEPDLEAEEFRTLLHASEPAPRRPVDDIDRLDQMLRSAQLIVSVCRSVRPCLRSHLVFFQELRSAKDTPLAKQSVCLKGRDGLQAFLSMLACKAGCAVSSNPKFPGKRHSAPQNTQPIDEV